MARNLQKQILHVEFDITKMTRKYGTLESAAADGYGSAEAGHLPIGVYGATNGRAVLPEGSMVTGIYSVCSDTFDDDSGGSAAQIKIGLDYDSTGASSSADDDEFWAATNAGSAPFVAGNSMSILQGFSSIALGSNAADGDTAAELAALYAAKAVRQTVSGEVVFELITDEITAGNIDIYIEYIPTGLIA